MPLNPGVTEAKIQEFLQAYNETDRFIPGLLDSAAGVDFDSKTVVWENNFVDEEVYSGPYMVHPYHAHTLDNYLLSDSPECITHDIFTVRYQLPEGTPRLDRGIRRVVLLKLPDGADISALETLAARPDGMATSVFSPDNVGWVSAKGRAWTHIWDQGFNDIAALERFLKTREGIASSSLEGFRRLGADVDTIKIFTYPFELKPSQSPAALAAETFPIFYTITARMDFGDVDTFIGLLERDYDPFLADDGIRLMHRWRTVDGSSGVAEVQSTWQLGSFAAFDAWRAKAYFDPRWNRFARDAMPLVKGGTRRFYRAA
jgi:hypothetical protein